MRVACILPVSVSEFRHKWVKDSIQMSGLMSVAGYLRVKKHQVEVFDFLADEGTTKEELDAKLVRFSPELVCICGMYCLEDIIEYLKEMPDLDPKPKICSMGTGAIDYSLALLCEPAIDYVIPVYPEEIVTDIAARLEVGQSVEGLTGVAYRSEQGISFTKRAFQPLDQILKNQDVRQFISSEDPTIAYLWGSRGCWHRNCTFCNVGAASRLCAGSGWLPRDVQMVVQDITSLYQLGVRQFHFLDAEFIGPGLSGQNRARTFAKALLETGLEIKFYIDARIDSIQFETFELLKKAGLSSVFMGVESGSPAILERLGKGHTLADIDQGIKIIRQLKVPFRIGSLLADPNCTLSEIKESLSMIESFKLFDGLRVVGVGSIFHEVHLHAGTPLYEEYLKRCPNHGPQGSEIPAEYYDRKVATFLEQVRAYQSEIVKRYHFLRRDGFIHIEKANQTPNFRGKYEYALRILAFSGIYKMLEIMENSNGDNKSINDLCNRAVQKLLHTHDQFWLGGDFNSLEPAKKN